MGMKTALAVSLLLGAALLACKKDDEGAAGSACKSDSDCKNGFLCESAACIPKAAADKIRGAQTAASASATAAAAGEGGAPEPKGKSAPDDSPVPEIPEGRSDPPTVAEWGDAEEINTQEKNSQPDQCEMKVVREWVRVSCRGEILNYEKMESFGTKNADYFEMIQPGKLASFVVRMKKGKTQSVRICRASDRASLFVSWPGSKDRPAHIALGKGPKCGS